MKIFRSPTRPLPSATKLGRMDELRPRRWACSLGRKYSWRMMGVNWRPSNQNNVKISRDGLGRSHSE